MTTQVRQLWCKIRIFGLWEACNGYQSLSCFSHTQKFTCKSSFLKLLFKTQPTNVSYFFPNFGLMFLIDMALIKSWYIDWRVWLAKIFWASLSGHHFPSVLAVFRLLFKYIFTFRLAANAIIHDIYSEFSGGWKKFRNLINGGLALEKGF